MSYCGTKIVEVLHFFDTDKEIVLIVDRSRLANNVLLNKVSIGPVHLKCVAHLPYCNTKHTSMESVFQCTCSVSCFSTS